MCEYSYPKIHKTPAAKMYDHLLIVFCAYFYFLIIFAVSIFTGTLSCHWGRTDLGHTQTSEFCPHCGLCLCWTQS